MSLDTYANLKTELADKLGRSDITSSSSIIDTAIDLLEAEVNAKLRTYDMIETTTLTTTATIETVNLPSDFVQPYSVYLSTDPSPLQLDTEQNIRMRFQRGLVGRPRVYSLYPGNKIMLAPIPDAVYTIYMQYYTSIDALSGSTTTNWLLQKYPGYYYYGALRHLFTYINDPETRQTILDEFQRIEGLIDLSEKKKRTQGAGMKAFVTGMTP